MKADQSLTNYCAKHDQRFMAFLSACPICAGEAMIIPVPDSACMPAETSNDLSLQNE